MLELLMFAVSQPQVLPATIQPIVEERRVECPNSDRRGPAGICLDQRDGSKIDDALKSEYQPPNYGNPGDTPIR